jgi:hypothetical protein
MIIPKDFRQFFILNSLSFDLFLYLSQHIRTKQIRKEERGKRKEERGKRKEERGKRKEERGKTFSSQPSL